MKDKIRFFLRSTSPFYTACIALVVQRLLHMGAAIEEPMAWRQYDTEFYAYSFFKNGIDLFNPSVCWLGSYKTLILEFPLISALISLVYDIFGHSVTYARIVILIFFIASAYYLYLLVKYLYNLSIARFSLIVYLLLPIGVYYSRAVVIDFPVLFFSLGALYYYIKGFDAQKLYLIVLATLFSVLGFLIKPPYQFIIYFPLFYYVVKNNHIKNFLKYLPIILVPLAVFVIWEIYTINTNENAPDWSFIPGYFKFTDMWQWYFGSLSDRLNFGNWEKFLFRFVPEGITFIGLPLFAAGLFSKPHTPKASMFFVIYLAGTIIYLILFFTLNLIHDYYQIALLPVTSFYIGSGLDLIYRKLLIKSKLLSNLTIALITLSLMVNGIWYTERWYYKIDRNRTEAARYIRENTEEESLVTASIDLTDPRDPRILAPAYRFGWQIRTDYLNGGIIDSLKKLGSNYLAVITKENIDNQLYKYLQGYKKQEFKILDAELKLLLYKLN